MKSKALYAGADNIRPQAGRRRSQDRRGLPRDGSGRANLPQVEEQVRRHGLERDTPPQAAGGGEFLAQTTRLRSKSGQAHAAGGALKKALRPVRKRALIDWLRDAYGVSMRRACKLIMLNRPSYRYRKVERDERDLVMRIRELAAARVRYGYRRITVLLQREGWRINSKRVYRIYIAEGLAVRTKRRRKRAARRRVAPEAAARSNERWSMDFVSDRLAGREGSSHPDVRGPIQPLLPVPVRRHLYRSWQGLRLSGRGRWASRKHNRGQRPGVQRQSPGLVGLSKRREAGLHTSRQADGKRLRGKLQRKA